VLLALIRSLTCLPPTARCQSRKPTPYNTSNTHNNSTNNNTNTTNNNTTNTNNHNNTEEATFAASGVPTARLPLSWAGRTAATGQLGISLDAFRDGGWSGDVTWRLYIYSVYFSLATLSSLGGGGLMHPWTIAEVGGGWGGGAGGCVEGLLQR